MNETLQVILNISRCLVMGLIFQGTALAQAVGQHAPQIQPALILALALTSLVLFCIYLVQKNRADKKRQTGQNKWAKKTHPVQTRLHETHKALNSLLTFPGIPIAKINLEQAQIIDATPALYQILGYKKKLFLNESPERLGLLPTQENEIRSLVENGWAQFSAPLVHRVNGKRIDCRILNIATHIDGSPMVLSIIPDLMENQPPDNNDTFKYTEN